MCSSPVLACIDAVNRPDNSRRLIVVVSVGAAGSEPVRLDLVGEVLGVGSTVLLTKSHRGVDAPVFDEGSERGAD